MAEALVREAIVRCRSVHRRVILALGFTDPGARRFHRGQRLLDQGLVRLCPRHGLFHGQGHSGRAVSAPAAE